MTVIVTQSLDYTTAMSTSIHEQVSSQERQELWTELQSLRQDTQAFRTEAYRLRTAGSLDAAANERLRSQQLELERRGEALIKRYARYSLFCSILMGNRLSPGLEWNVELGSGMRYSPLRPQTGPLIDNIVT